MHTSRRRLFLAICLATILAGVLVGCGTSSNTAAQRKNCVGGIGCTKVHRVPVDGESCEGASESEVAAWVKGKQEEIPGGISVERVQSQAYSVCAAATKEKRQQAFGTELLSVAIRGASAP